MKLRHRRNLALASAVAAVALAALPVAAQVAAGQNGHAMDANMQVGSGGYNANVAQPGVTPNQVIYGNVTGGTGFSGPVLERDPGAFFGPIPMLGDTFARTTAGAPPAYQAQTNTYTPRPFYGDSRAVAPPVGTISNGYSGGYVGTQYQTDNPYSLRNEIASSLDLSRQQAGKSSVIGSSQDVLQNSDELQASQDNLNGQLLNPLGSVPLYAGSPLYGQVPLGDLAGGIPSTDQAALFGAPSLAPGGTDRFRQSAASIRQMQSELINAQNGNPQSSTLSNQDNSQNPGSLQPGAIASAALNRPIDGVQNNTLNSSPTGTNGNPGLPNDLNTNQDYQRRMNQPGATLTPGANALNQQLIQYHSPIYQRMVDQLKFNRQLRASIQKNGGLPGTPGATSRPASGLPGDSGMIQRNNLPATNLPSTAVPTVQEPVKVTSLAEGVTAKGLHDLLSSAEEMMRQDKFESAIKQYNTADQVAPGNGLISLGRANAELGAGYYQLANVDLHQLFEKDPALLMGQYDLKSWMSANRLKFINKELTDLATSDTHQEMPVFLLAYIAYNTGDGAKAAEFLANARQRAGGHDPVLEKLETSWRLPAADLNK